MNRINMGNLRFVPPSHYELRMEEKRQGGTKRKLPINMTTIVYLFICLFLCKNKLKAHLSSNMTILRE